MLPLAKNALSFKGFRSIQRTMTRQSHQKWAPDFHDKYGNAILASGATFCVAGCMDIYKKLIQKCL
uniref:Cytochrome c oxidase subunit 7B, mitochondrial n=1 Tax=Catagonus wagneri TaxID=51154 RepID=A0A8C3YLL9_9CETA